MQNANIEPRTEKQNRISAALLLTAIKNIKADFAETSFRTIVDEHISLMESFENRTIWNVTLEDETTRYQLDEDANIEKVE